MELSTGESEFYSMLKGASQGIGLQSLLADWSIAVGLRLHTDAGAGKALAERKGLGKAKRVASKSISVHKIPTSVNRADMLTKYKETARGGLAVNVVEC